MNSQKSPPLRIPGKTYDPLTRLEVVGLAALCVLVVAFGYMTLRRGALYDNHMTDLSVYCVAAWAFNHDVDLYSVSNLRDWHFVYPPAFALAMSPFAVTPKEYAQPPELVEGAWLPWPAIVVAWYVISVVVLALAVHVLATALERGSRDQGVRDRPKYCRDFWGIRIFPVLFCMPSVMSSIVRGQTDFLILAAICFMAASAVSFGQRMHARGGAWLSIAISLKIVPALLIVYPLWRRDRRMLGGVVAGCLFLLVAVPLVVMGPEKAWHATERFVEVVILPGVGVGTDTSRAKELIEITATDNQSFKATMHNLLWFNTDRAERPGDAAAWVRMLHWSLMLVMIALTCWAAGWTPKSAAGKAVGKEAGEADKPLVTPLHEVLFIGLLTELMLLFSPVTHLHYFLLWIPLVMALLMWDRERRGRVGISLDVLLLMVAVFIAGLLPRIPGLRMTLDLGVVTWAGVLLWVVGVAVLRKLTVQARNTSEPAAAA